MNEANTSTAIKNRRRHPRIIFGEGQLHATAHFGDGEAQEFQVIARNVSRGGIALWREKPIKEGEACTLALPTRDGEIIGIAGTVAFSKRLGMTVNEIGIRFDRPLDEDEFGMLEIVDAGGRRAAG